MQASASAGTGRPEDVGVDFEYGDLREVIVGVPFIVYPDLEVATWVQEAVKILPADELEKMWQRSGKDSIALGVYDQLEQENAGLIAVLEQYGVTVHRPEVLSRERVAANFGEEYVRFAGVSQQYARDPMLVIGSNVIELTMGSLYRRSDILGLKRLFLERVAGSNAQWVAMPSVDYALMVADGQFDKTGFPVLEGGDVIVLGETILVGTSANKATGSSELGYRWLRSFLEPQGYRVQRVPLPEEVLHLDVVLSVPRPGLLVVCADALADGIPPYFDGWQRIEVTLEEARYLATNGLPLDRGHYILGSCDGCDGTRVQRALEEGGIEVHRIPFQGHIEHGGSVRCSTQPLVRRLAT